MSLRFRSHDVGLLCACVTGSVRGDPRAAAYGAHCVPSLSKARMSRPRAAPPGVHAPRRSGAAPGRPPHGRSARRAPGRRSHHSPRGAMAAAAAVAVLLASCASVGAVRTEAHSSEHCSDSRCAWARGRGSAAGRRSMRCSVALGWPEVRRGCGSNDCAEMGATTWEASSPTLVSVLELISGVASRSVRARPAC